jgi:fatty-acyl-CoA synthase
MRRYKVRTLGDWIRLHAKRSPRTEAFVAGDGRVTFGEAAGQAWRLARGLRAAGIGDGDVVGVLGGNTVFNAQVLLGVAAAGGIYGAYNWRWSAEELAHGIAESNADLIVTEERFEDLLTRALDILAGRPDATPAPRVVRQGEIASLLGDSGAPVEETIGPEDGLCLIFTGGSTGTSKAVLLSHRAALANALNERLDCRLGDAPDERALMSTPMFHSAGVLTWLVTHFVAGKTTIMVDRFEPDEFVNWVTRERATNTFLIPNMARQLMQAGAFADPGVRRSFRALHTGAGLLRMPDKERFFEQLPEGRLYFRYGLTEGGPMVSRLLHEDILRPEADGSIGQEYSLVEMTLLSLDDEEQVGPGELGEICVRGPSLMTGYYRRPAETAEAMRGGWLHTGDLAIRDEHGYYFFKDRVKEMIKTGGENVYCVEIEQILYLHPAVLEAAVVGVPSTTWDEEVRAVVVLRDGMSVSDQELATYLRQHLAGYKIPKKFSFLKADELPRTGAGKLVKTRLKEQLGWM